MTQAAIQQTALSAGEVSPLLYGRTDFQRYAAGLRTARGFVSLAGGGITRAPGTIYLGETDQNRNGRLIPFEFAEDDALILEFTAASETAGGTGFRVWRYGELVMDGGAPYKGFNGMSGGGMARLRTLDYAQAADVIYFADGVFPIHALSRNALDDWLAADVEFEKGPFNPLNFDIPSKVEAEDDGSGDYNIYTTPTDLFSDDYAGALLRIQTASYDPDDSSTFGIVRLTISPTLTGTPGKWSAEKVDQVPAELVGLATFRWAIGAWNYVDGFPKSVTIHDQHLCFAATDRLPRSFWISAAGDYLDFQASSAADKSAGYIIPGDNSLNRIKWIRPGADGLLIGSLGEVHRVFPPDGRASLGPTNIARVREATIGVSDAKPIFPTAYPVIVPKGENRIVELRRTGQAGSIPVPLSLPASHIGQNGFKDIVWQELPFQRAWMPQPEGGLACMVYQPTEEVLAWATVPVAGGVVQSVCVTPDPERGRDVVTMIVAREIGGETRYCVEELAENQGVLEGSDPAYMANHLFASLVFDEEVATDTFSVAHLIGEEVYAWTNEGGFGPITVAGDGTVTLPAEVTYAVIGLLDETHEFETLSLNAPARDGASTHRRRRLHDGGVVLHRTAAGTVQSVEREFKREYAHDPEHLVPLEIMGGSATAHSGVVPVNTVSGMTAEVSLRFRPIGGAPMTILGFAQNIEESGA